jgi:hypothetical protein
MVDTSAKIDLIIRDYIEKSVYFTITRARQFGKTTMLKQLCQRLRERYVVINISFDKDEDYFATFASFAEGFSSDMVDCIDNNEMKAVFGGEAMPNLPFQTLSNRITKLCEVSPREIILVIDEADKATVNQVFLDFLGILRDKYMTRTMHDEPTFKSVILASVHDITNLKLKPSPDKPYSHSIPWNIAAHFKMDMSFSTPEIVTMLTAYEQDYHTGMDIMKVAEKLYYYTSGYPVLVSLLCKTIHDEQLDWSERGVSEVMMRVLKTNNALFEDVVKNIVNHPSLGAMVRRHLVNGTTMPSELLNPDVDLGMTYGILKAKNWRTAVSNALFETILYDYFISIAETSGRITPYTEDKSLLIQDGHLVMSAVLNRFAALMQSEYRDEDGSFIEHHERLLFLSFLKSIINGSGQYTIEPETRDWSRMDLVVFYGGEEHIVELKIWHGEQAATEAYDQLAGYLIAREQREGYLLSFCDNQKAPREGKTITHNGCKIIEVIVAYRDKE